MRLANRRGQRSQPVSLFTLRLHRQAAKIANGICNPPGQVDRLDALLAAFIKQNQGSNSRPVHPS
ncbi:hypothetical protein SAMN05444166_5673 [Singulisphaera sp. GP187]|uniref:hypothetical protein n=1 Tax=Singulisphaera sp. GP187 TaxID=1882752 RepID=UPI0009274276|nr:hypothetical protein [Singulisphaera sp. GP187]SIO58421.1 hypothetical protein SAMN05444166_5673 [Singulisphaera sp. GP187]